MRSASTKLVAALASLLIALPVTGAFSETATADYPTQQHILRTADDALETLTQVRMARIDLLENRIDDAKTAVANATRALAKAEAHIGSLGVKGFGISEPDVQYLPFDMSMNVIGTLDGTDETTLALQEANKLIVAADPGEAVDVLRAAEIDVLISTALLPAQQSMMHLQDASALLSEGKYFEASIALKAIEQGVVIDSFKIDSIPKQGDIQ